MSDHVSTFDFYTSFRLDFALISSGYRAFDFLGPNFDDLVIWINGGSILLIFCVLLKACFCKLFFPAIYVISLNFDKSYLGRACRRLGVWLDATTHFFVISNLVLIYPS